METLIKNAFCRDETRVFCAVPTVSTSTLCMDVNLRLFNNFPRRRDKTFNEGCTDNFTLARTS